MLFTPLTDNAIVQGRIFEQRLRPQTHNLAILLLPHLVSLRRRNRQASVYCFLVVAHRIAEPILAAEVENFTARFRFPEYLNDRLIVSAPICSRLQHMSYYFTKAGKDDLKTHRLRAIS